MKALVMNKPGDVVLTEISTPVPKPDEVLIRVRAAGICVNDVRDYKGECNYSYPRIGGHEFSGEICELGADVNKQRFHIGQKVVTYVIDNCEECYYCKHGYENVCPDFAHTKCYQNPGGISGFMGFAQYITAKASHVYICEKHVPYEKLAIVEPIACVLNSINKTNIEFGDDVLVIGGGTMGMLHVMLAHMRGARVILSEPMEQRRQKALEIGADVVIDPQGCDVVKEIKQITKGIGARIVFDTTAVPDLALQAIECTAICGTAVMFSSLHPNKLLEVDMGKIHSTQKTITGAQNGSVKTFWQGVQLLNKNLLDPEPIIEGIYDYHDFEEAMACAMRPDTYKVIMRITD